MRKEKLTQLQRIGRLEKVVSQLYLINSMIQKELKILQEKTNDKNSVI